MASSSCEKKSYTMDHVESMTSWSTPWLVMTKKPELEQAWLMAEMVSVLEEAAAEEERREEMSMTGIVGAEESASGFFAALVLALALVLSLALDPLLMLDFIFAAMPAAMSPPWEVVGEAAGIAVDLPIPFFTSCHLRATESAPSFSADHASWP